MTKAPALSHEASQLRTRLGKGARFDAEGAPALPLRLARHGMAYFSRQLNELSDEALLGPSRIAGWNRAQVVAHVCIEARAQALGLAALRGQALDEEFDWDPDIDLTATLPPRALRHLFDHAHVHVNVEWRDLATADWANMVTLPTAERLAARGLPGRQARLLWWGAVALNASAAEGEIPAGVTPPEGPLAALGQLHKPNRTKGSAA